MLDPATLSQKAPLARAYIESVIVDRKQFAATGNLELAPRPRELQIDYTSPTFTAPQKVKFRYRLDPYDADWHDAGTRRQAFYTDVPPGNYTFRVAAANIDGTWNEEPATLDFSVPPAYFQTNWFRALCVVLLLALLWMAYRLRVRHLQRQFDVTLNARVGERTRIARDLHDTLLQSFHGLLLRFQTALSLLPDRPGDARQVLASAIDQAADAITEGRDAVQGLRASAAEGNDLADAFRAIGEELGNVNGKDVSLRVDVQGAPRDLHPIVRDEVFRIGSEALRNAFRHAAARQIEVELRYDDRQLRLRVRDDGKGIDPEVLRAEGREGHFGLHGMRERAKLVGGKLTIWSGPDSGTEIELSIPAAHAYSKPSSPWSRLTEKVMGQGDTANS
jgi:signal transduction histidine kinase